MRKLLLVLIAVPAAAQPVTTPARCEVTISRAPDEVRDAIDAWVAREPRCVTTLEVRAIPTDGGYYLFARDAEGRVRERVVPDAQSAGVLVASWVADDGIAPPPTTEDAAPAAAAIAPTPATLEVMPPGATPAIPPVAPVVAKPPPPHEGRFLSLGGIVQVHGGGAGGVRAELDLVQRGRWRLGAILAGSSADLDIAGASYGYLTTVDVRLLAALSRHTPIGARWDLRLALGAGVMSTYAEGEVGTENIEGHGVFPTAEASVMFARTLRGGWAVAFGPIVTWYSQTYRYEDDFGAMQTLTNRGLEAMAFGGVRRRL